MSTLSDLAYKYLKMHNKRKRGDVECLNLFNELISSELNNEETHKKIEQLSNLLKESHSGPKF